MIISQSLPTIITPKLADRNVLLLLSMKFNTVALHQLIFLHQLILTVLMLMLLSAQASATLKVQTWSPCEYNAADG
jgi:hypothetical protein